jgi:hypothetical protein
MRKGQQQKYIAPNYICKIIKSGFLLYQSFFETHTAPCWMKWLPPTFFHNTQ